MEQTLTFKRDAQGWQSQHDGRLVVAERNLCYDLDREGKSLNEHIRKVRLEKMLGDFYLAR